MKDFWMANENDLFTEKQISGVIPISHSSFVKLRKHKTEYSIPFIRIGRKYLYKKRDIVQWIEERKIY